MEVTKVWVVMSQGGNIWGVYSSPENAESAKAAAERPRRKMDGGSVVIEHSVYEYLVDDGVW